MHPFSFSSTELAVKTEQHLPNVNTLELYVFLGIERAKKCATASQTKSAHMRVVNTLTETMCDDCLSLEWRESCHKWIRKLLPVLFEILPTCTYWQELENIKLLKGYFLTNKCAVKHRDVSASSGQASSNLR
jgi:hypothetical protein